MTPSISIKKVYIAFITLSMVLTSSHLFAAEYRALANGVVQISIATVGGVHCYTVAERNALQAARPGDPVVNFTHTFYETAISTTIAKFGIPGVSPVDDFRGLLSSKAYIAERAVELEKDVLALERIQLDYPAINVTQKLNRLKAQINLLYSIWSSL